MMRHDKQGFDTEHTDLRHGISKCAILLKSMRYTDKDGVTYKAPAGMATDGGSIPAFFYRTISPPYASPFLRAYLIHDAICDTARHLWEGGDHEGAKILRKEGDVLFHEMLLFLGASKSKAYIMYAGVRVGALNLRNNKRAKPESPSQ